MIIQKNTVILLSLFCISLLSLNAQTPASVYLKIKSADALQKVEAQLRNELRQSYIYRPFSAISFDGLNRILRIDTPGIPIEAIARTAGNENVEYIEKVPFAYPAYTPNDLGVELGSPNQWSLYKIKAKNAWDFSKGSASTLIAVVDNAFLSDHTEFANKFSINPAETPGDGLDNDGNGYVDDYQGWNATGNNGDVYISSSNSNHGTHVAGIAAAETDNNEGMAAIGFLSSLLPVKAGNASDVITHGYEGISFAADRGAAVINCSWGSFDSSATAKSVIEYALSKNCFVVASAGNFANEQALYPATYAGVISVAATTQSDAKLNTSSFGRRINISAPGSGIWSCSFTVTALPSYDFKSGTSMAAPHVSGLLGLMHGYAPENSDSVILRCLYESADPIDQLPANSAYDSLLGTGRINAERSMQCLQSFYGLSANEENIPAFGLWPNPASEQLFISVLTGNDEPFLRWEIISIHGKSIGTGIGSSVLVDTLSPGIYFLRIRNSQNGTSQTIKFIKK